MSPLSFEAKASPFEDISEQLGLPVLSGDAFASGWMDLTMDGYPEPFFLTESELHYLTWVDGVLTVQTVPLATDTHTPQITVSTVVLDLDRDGVMELVTIGRGVFVYKLVAPGKLLFDHVALDSLTQMRAANDAAAGDMNHDGYPDIVIANMGWDVALGFNTGARDMILVNHEGRLVAQDIAPKRKAITHAISLADINRDGRLDIIESVSIFGLTGPGRILLNTTEAGDSLCSFVEAPFTYDHQSFGMGAAIGDIDQDGWLDIYNASAGRDYLMFGKADGSFEDRTFLSGARHEWGGHDLRLQWSPTILDINADGRLDIFARHGHLGDEEIFGLGAHYAEPNLAYLQSPDGSFKRAEVPFDPDTPVGGIDAVFGDIDRDGLPDVIMGSTLSAWFGWQGFFGVDVSPLVWMNRTDVEQGQRMAIDLEPTVSAAPATGARVTGTCQGESQTRYLQTGGKLGGSVSGQLFFGWPGCTEAMTFTVVWPSGVTSKHSVAAGETTATLKEPEWIAIGLTDNGLEMNLRPDLAGTSVCASLDGEQWNCCEEACIKPYHAVPGKRGWARIEEARTMALPVVGGQFTFMASPNPVPPNSTFTLKVTHSGGLGLLPEEVPWLRYGGVKIPWDTGPDAHGTYTASLQAPEKGDETPLIDILLTTKKMTSQRFLLGHAFDSKDPDIAPYFSANPITKNPWTLSITPGMENPSEKTIENLSVRYANGDEVYGGWKVTQKGLVKFSAAFDHIKEGASLTVFDGENSRLGPFPVYHQGSDEALLAAVDSARGFLQRTHVVGGREQNRLFFMLADKNGHALVPRAEIITLEVDGATIIDPPRALEGRPWELTAGMMANPGAGKVTIRARTIDDRVIGEWWYTRREAVQRVVSADLSYATLSHESLPAGVGATADLRVHVLNTWGELVSADISDVSVTSSELVAIGPVEVSPAGYLSFPVSVGLFGGTATMTVEIEGKALEPVALEIIGPTLPELDRYQASWPDDEPATEPTTAPPTPTDSGCAALHQESPGSAFLFLFLVLSFLGIRRRRLPL